MKFRVPWRAVRWRSPVRFGRPLTCQNVTINTPNHPGLSAWAPLPTWSMGTSPDSWTGPPEPFLTNRTISPDHSALGQSERNRSAISAKGRPCAGGNCSAGCTRSSPCRRSGSWSRGRPPRGRRVGPSDVGPRRISQNRWLKGRRVVRARSKGRLFTAARENCCAVAREGKVENSAVCRFRQ